MAETEFPQFPAFELVVVWMVLQWQRALVLASLGQIASLIGLRGFAPIAAEQILSQTNQNKMEDKNEDKSYFDSETYTCT